MSESQKIQLTSLPDPRLQYYFAYQSWKELSKDHEKPHIHDSYEIYVNVSGDVAFLVNNSLYPVQKGDVVVSDMLFKIRKSGRNGRRRQLPEGSYQIGDIRAGYSEAEELNETLEQAAMVHGFDCELLVEKINAFLNAKNA